MPDWLLASIVLSLALTVVLNVLVRVLPRRSRQLGDHVGRQVEAGREPDHEQSRVRVYVPWRLMIGLSIIGTIVLNILR